MTTLLPNINRPQDLHSLSEEELQAWQRAFDTHGLPGLRATRLHARRGRRLTAADPQD